jgi:IS605 OrfB family transposase
MKLQKTLKIKIGKLSNNKKDILNVLFNKNLKAIHFCLQKGKGQWITHNLVYEDLRKMNLPATIINGCRNKAREIVKSWKTNKYRLHKNISLPKPKALGIRYDNQVVKLRKTDNKLFPYFISLLYKAGIQGKHNNRIELPLIVNSDYQNKIIEQIGQEYKLGSTELVKKNNELYVYISYSKDIEIPIPDSSFSPIGIDIGINNLAVSVAQPKVRFFSGKRINWKNEFFRKQRHKLISNFAYQELKRLKGQQTRYNNFYINNISKQIVEDAKNMERPVIVLENLKHIQETTKVRKKQRARHSEWVFRKLQQSIEYKALWEGIPVIYIKPNYSSQRCNNCGELNKRIKHTYKCKSCGYEANADFNACKNLQHFFLAKCQEEQASINNASNQIIPEPQAKKDDLVRKFNKEVAGPFCE